MATNELIVAHHTRFVIRNLDKPWVFFEVLILTKAEDIMTKKKCVRKDKETKIKSKQPEFKPGNKPYCQFGKEILNKNVPWDKVLSEIVVKGYSPQAVALQIGTKLSILKQIEKKHFDKLSFRAGARMLSIHYRVSPECYSDI
jgi:hypothetical protein